MELELPRDPESEDSACRVFVYHLSANGVKSLTQQTEAKQGERVLLAPQISGWNEVRVDMPRGVVREAFFVPKTPSIFFAFGDGEGSRARNYPWVEVQRDSEAGTSEDK